MLKSCVTLKPKAEYDRQLTNPMHTDRREDIGWSSRLSAAGDWER